MGLGSGANAPWVFILECVHHREGDTHHLFKGEKTQRWRGEIYHEPGEMAEDPPGVGRGQSANEQISEATRSENKNTGVHIAQLQGCMEKKKKKKNTIKKNPHLKYKKSSMMCSGMKAFSTAFFLRDLTQPTTGTPSTARI